MCLQCVRLSWHGSRDNCRGPPGRGHAEHHAGSTAPYQRHTANRRTRPHTVSDSRTAGTSCGRPRTRHEPRSLYAPAERESGWRRELPVTPRANDRAPATPPRTAQPLRAGRAAQYHSLGRGCREDAGGRPSLAMPAVEMPRAPGLAPSLPLHPALVSGKLYASSSSRATDERPIP